MRFEERLKEESITEWRRHYIDYGLLKRMIDALSFNQESIHDNNDRFLSISTEIADPSHGVVAVLDGKRITNDDFFTAFEQQVDKVAAFFGEYFAKLKAASTKIEDDVAILCSSADHHEQREEKQRFSAIARETGDGFLKIERFANLNFMACHKILKKHDKYIPKIPCKPFYLSRLQNQMWVSEDFSKTLVILSKIHAKLRGEIKPLDQELASSFTRKTTKYWIKTADVSKVKHAILQHLPVFQLNLDALHGDSQLTNSVYLDNEQCELYQGRVTKIPHAICIRLRWYGTGEPKLVFVERKTHEDSWTDDLSVKQRFALHPDNVVPFLQGKYSLEAALKDFLAPNSGAPKTESETADFKELFTEISAQVRAKQLEPQLRTRCMRVAYQIPFVPTVRVSIDTNLSMMMENPASQPTCKQVGRWYRDPTHPVPHSEITSFPHSVLEVKLALEEGQEMPEWTHALISNTEMLHEVDKFSKFAHGCAVMMRDRVPFLPYWFDDISIRSSIARSQNVLEPKVAGEAGAEVSDVICDAADFSSTSSSTPLLGVAGSDFDAAGAGSRNKLRNRSVTSSEQSRDDYVPGVGKMRNAKEYQMLNANDEERKSSQSLSAPVTCGENDCCLPMSCFGCKQKKEDIIPRKMPMRIEPKTYFANERTYLKWIHIGITLGGVGGVLLGFADHHQSYGIPESSSIYSGLMLLLTSILIVMYAMRMYWWRAKMITERIEGPFHDSVGPFLLGGMIVLSLAAVFFFSVLRRRHVLV